MIFITGATGLVGSHVLLKLLKQSKKVKALKRESSSLKVCKNVFSYYKADDLFKKIMWIDGDVNDICSLEEGMKGCNFLFHCAAIVSFSPKDRKVLKKVNIEGTSNVMNVALSLGIKKAGFISSIAALGKNSLGGFINEECIFKATKFDSNYALSKHFAEQEVWRASAEGLDVIIINPSVILGPGDWEKGSSNIFTKIYKGLKYYSSGSTGYVDVEDVAESLIQLVFSSIKNERFIVSGFNLKYRDCFDRIALALGKKKSYINVTPFLKELIWRFEAIKSMISGKKPLITKESANNAMIARKYTSNKLEEKIKFKFTPIDNTINKYAKWFILDQN